MAYGILDVYCGPMTSSKTSALLQQVVIHRTLYNKNVIVFKPAIDKRYSEVEIVNHNGLKTEAYSVSSNSEILEILRSPFDIAVFDEIQFFVSPYYKGDFIDVIKFILSLEKQVYCAGLDMDYKGNPFIITAKLLAMADNVHKLTAVCAQSKLPANKTFKLSGVGPSIEVGGLDKYEARNNKFWHIPKET